MYSAANRRRARAVANSLARRNGWPWTLPATLSPFGGDASEPAQAVGDRFPRCRSFEAAATPAPFAKCVRTANRGVRPVAEGSAADVAEGS